MTKRDSSDRDRGDWGADPELRALIRSVDPSHSLPLSTSGDIGRLTAATIEADAATPREMARRRRPGNHRVALLAAAAAVVAVAGTGLWSATRTDQGPSASATGSAAAPSATAGAPTDAVTTTLRLPAPTTAKCMVPNVEVLALQDTAFEGTVTAIDAGTVSLQTGTVYAGDVAEQVQVQAPSPDLTSLLSAVDFEVGKSYLVSATDGQVSLCGFSAEAGPDLQALYQQAFIG